MLALQDVFDMRDDSVFKAASGLHGGIGFMHDTCGVLIGAGMMLGVKYGRSREETNRMEEIERPDIPVGKIYKWFEREFGTVKCREISTKHSGGIFYDTSVPWQQELAMEAGMYDKCDELIRKAVTKTAEMLWDAIEAEKNKKES